MGYRQAQAGAGADDDNDGRGSEVMLKLVP
jgi:hypothetical protein